MQSYQAENAESQKYMMVSITTSKWIITVVRQDGHMNNNNTELPGLNQNQKTYSTKTEYGHNQGSPGGQGRLHKGVSLSLEEK